jgi:hypothetical protein
VDAGIASDPVSGLQFTALTAFPALTAFLPEYVRADLFISIGWSASSPLMPNSAFEQISHRDPDDYSPERFEEAISKALNEDLPFSVLERVVIFAPADLHSSPFAYEIDQLFHYRENAIDYLVLIECKIPQVVPRNDQWEVQYASGPKDIKAQVWNHSRALRSYLQPLPRETELRMKSVVVSLRSRNSLDLAETLSDGSEARLCSVQKFAAYVSAVKERARDGSCKLCRVNQSDILGLLRLGAPVKTLGHPEIANAHRYVKRCRRRLDAELRSHFKPTVNRWAINGTAGMGKSVLLAYTACVLASDRELASEGDGYRLESFHEKSARCRIPPVDERRIVVYSMRSKQLEALERLYQEFLSQFRDAQNQRVQIAKPVFKMWSDQEAIPEDANVLLIDECHDLPPQGQKKLAKWYEAGRYLVVAVDRHQKLRLVGPAAKILEEFDFAGHTRRLKRIYRNPTPIYLAGLAIMFRWFSDSGPKVLPDVNELKDEFGLASVDSLNGTLDLKIRDDSHPANGWTNTVGEFRSASVAYSQLQGLGLAKEDVLWVRFSKEDPEFNYELLSKFTYHNLNSSEGPDHVDKYIKGQDFFIVVVEGFSDWINKGTDKASPSAMSPEERTMWVFRRQIYLCCSRATGFLYFVYNVPRTEAQFRRELTALVDQLSTPPGSQSASGNRWCLSIKKPVLIRKMADFPEWPPQSKSPVPVIAISPKPVPVKVPVPKPILVTPSSLARQVGMKPYEIIELLEKRKGVPPGINDAIPWADVVWLGQDVDFDPEALLSAANET